MSQIGEPEALVGVDEQTREGVLAELQEIERRTPHAPTPMPQLAEPEPTLPDAPPHLPVLTSLRFMFAVLVVFGHCLGRFGLPATVWQLAQSVTFFFVLSGFTLVYAYPELPKQRVLAFYRARAARIWPVYLLAIAAVLIFLPSRLGLEPDTWSVVKRVLGDVFMVQFWVFDEFRCLIGATWTLSTLAALYLMYPLIVYKWEKTWHVKLVGSVLVLAFVFYACHELGWRKYFYEFGPYRISSPVYLHFLSRQFEFVLGMVAALAWRRLSVRFKPKRGIATVLEVGAILLVLASVPACLPLLYWALSTPWAGAPVVTWFGMGGLASFAVAAMIIVMAMQRGIISSWLSRPIPVMLGKMSLSMYLTHQIFMMYYVGRMQAFPDWPNWVLLSLYWVIVLVTAHFLWWTVDVPARRFLRGRRLPTVATEVPLSAPALFRLPVAWWTRLPVRIFAEAALLFLLVLGMVGMAHTRPNVEVVDSNASEDARAVVDRSRHEVRNVVFGKRFELLGIATRDLPANLEVKLVWKSLKRQPLDYNVRFQMLSKADGEILGRQAFRQDINVAVVDEGFTWIETRVLPKSLFQGVTMMGIIVNKEGDSLLPDRGLRDSGRRRLLLPIDPMP